MKCLFYVVVERKSCLKKTLGLLLQLIALPSLKYFKNNINPTTYESSLNSLALESVNKLYIINLWNKDKRAKLSLEALTSFSKVACYFLKF